jgi:hypothetical protein
MTDFGKRTMKDIMEDRADNEGIDRGNIGLDPASDGRGGLIGDGNEIAGMGQGFRSNSAKAALEAAAVKLGYDPKTPSTFRMPGLVSAADKEAMRQRYLNAGWDAQRVEEAMSGVRTYADGPSHTSDYSWQPPAPPPEPTARDKLSDQLKAAGLNVEQVARALATAFDQPEPKRGMPDPKDGRGHPVPGDRW